MAPLFAELASLPSPTISLRDKCGNTSNGIRSICRLQHEPFLVHSTMTEKQPTLNVRFFRTPAGNDPVREWLSAMPRDHKRMIGIEIKTVQFGWPIGMPIVRKLERGLWEVRADLLGTIARVLFTLDDNSMVLLHGFIKKSQKTPAPDLETARQRKAILERNKQ